MIVYAVYEGDDFEGYRIVDNKVYHNLHDAIKGAKKRISELNSTTSFKYKKTDDFVWESKILGKIYVNTLDYIK